MPAVVNAGAAWLAGWPINNNVRLRNAVNGAPESSTFRRLWPLGGIVVAHALWRVAGMSDYFGRKSISTQVIVRHT